jgi:large repetitive protein
VKGSSVPFGGHLQRSRAALVSWLAVAVAVGGVVAYAVQAEGYQAHKAELNDGGIWVTSNRDGSYGRINKPIGELDGTIFSRIDSTLDIVQDGSSVVGVNLSDGVVMPLDPAQMRPPDGEEAAIPGSPAVGMAGGSLAVLDTASGKLWATNEDPKVGVPPVSSLADQTDPVATVGEDAALAVALDGTVYAVSADTDELLTVRQGAGGRFAVAATEPLPGAKFSDAIELTTVGAVPIVLDSAKGRLLVIGGAEAALPKGAVLQQPGPSASSVLVGAREGLLSVDLATGVVTTIASGVGGDPANPVRLGDCSYGAWAGGTGAVVTACGDPGASAPTPQGLDAQTSDLVFRTNRGQIVLNDRATGNVWDIDSDKPTRLDNWDAFHLKAEDSNDDDDQQHQNQGDRRPPVAKNDRLGARPGRTTILHPLDNDTAPSGRLLAIRSVRDVSGARADLAISPDGQTVQITLPNDAVGGTSFEYFIDDGRQSVSAHATVHVAISTGSANSAPQLREGFEPHVWTVPASGTIDVPVLPDWRDPNDGDPVSAVSARETTGPTDGADARVTESGAIRFHAPSQGGLANVEYQVTDGLGPPVKENLSFRIQDPTDLDAVSPMAEPDVLSGETGKPIVITPLANDLPGSDPITPDATLALAGPVGNVPGADVVTNLVKGTITLRSKTAQTYFLDYQAAYGTAQTSTGKIRVDVRAPENPPLDPVAVPDSTTLFGQAASLVDVLANDVDPSGGLLSVQRAWALSDNQLDVAVVNGRWLRISARQGELSPNPQVVRYTISNGQRSGIAGQVVVSQRPPPADNTPVVQNDDVTVRAGTALAIPVLDNDFSPSGGTLSLVSDGVSGSSGRLDVEHVGGEARGATGAAFVAGRTVRYVAPTNLSGPKDFTIRYQVADEQGETATGKVRVTVLPVQADNNNPPEPPVVEGRTVSGDTVKLRLPGYGVDPDGDAVTILGLDSAPSYGRVTRIGANSIEYTAYPDSVGTDEFTYDITDSLGATATGTARVSITPPGPPQPPLAVADAITVAPGRSAVVDVLANDLVAPSSRVTLTLVDPPAGVTTRSTTGPIEIAAPVTARKNLQGRSLDIVYRITDGLESSQATLTLRTAEGYNNPPIVSDAFGATGNGRTVTADVLSAGTATSGSTSGAYDPDGPFEDLKVADVYAPPGIATRINGGRITVERGARPLVVPFRVEDADGGAATGSLYVPAANSGLPYVKSDAQIQLKPGAEVKERLTDFVVNPSGGPVDFTLKSRMWPSPAPEVSSTITGDGRFTVRAARGYEGPGAVVFEVMTSTSLNDPNAIKATLSVPVQVGVTRPILRCPHDPIDVPQAESVRVDLAALCHVWTADPGATAGLDWSAAFDDGTKGLDAAEPQGGVVQVTASDSAVVGDTDSLRVAAGNSAADLVTFRVVRTPPPSLAPIRISTLKAGESQTIDLARYLTPGVSNPVPTVVAADQLTDLGVQISHSGSSVTITTGPQAHGHAEFRVVMSDVADNAGPQRTVEGRIAVDILGVPDVPGVPVPGTKFLDSKVSLDWKPAESNGAPVDFYEVRDQFGHTSRCPSTSCTITGLTNGTAYRFQVRAHNAVGFSEWSRTSASATPDKPIDLVGRIRLVEAGDGFLHIAWKPIEGKNGAQVVYVIRWAGGQLITAESNVMISSLDNHRRYRFHVIAKNIFTIGNGLTSPLWQPIGTPGTPAPPTLTDQETPGSQGAVSLTWPAVDPNGPAPVRYTVLRNNAALANCKNIKTRSCDVSGIAYNGSIYNFQVLSVNDDGDGVSSPAGAVTQWKAIGKPASWGPWSVSATGNNNEAKAQFTVPPSRGAASFVRVYADGVRVWQSADKSQQEAVFEVANNSAPHSVTLEVCNENGACTQSSAQSVQTWGPLVPAYIHSITPTLNGTTVSWTIEVDSNGDPARVTVASDKRNETFQVPVGVSTVTTSAIDIGYDASETVTVTLADDAPNRGAVTASGSTSTPPPPPTVVVSKGEPCNDTPGSGLPNCNHGNGPGADCTDPSCAFVNVDIEHFNNGGIFCSFNGGPLIYGPFNENGVHETDFYFGSPGQTVVAWCANGPDSAASQPPPLVW